MDNSTPLIGWHCRICHWTSAGVKPRQCYQCQSRKWHKAFIDPLTDCQKCQYLLHPPIELPKFYCNGVATTSHTVINIATQGGA